MVGGVLEIRFSDRVLAYPIGICEFHPQYWGKQKEKTKQY